MERESFEDRDVAAVLNNNFVSIKVDREERPDIDAIYMSVCQAMTGHGGWPMTVIMTPDKKPFFAGTYFPKNDARGMPGLISILNRVTQLWQHHKDELVASGEKITEAVETSLFAHTEGEASKDVIEKAYNYYAQSYDSRYGGFGQAPKFPTPHNLSFLLRYWKMTGDAAALEMVEKTLDAMYRGGIYDHIGFGFARYSTDRQWLAPHFEKMLYDNALLAIAYLETYQATGREQYAKAAREIFTYILRDMTSPEGAFYSAEDADSEGEEGKFYVWTPEEVEEALGSELGEGFCRDFDITPEGNFEGRSIPNLIKTGLVEGYNEARKKLFHYRDGRVHPFKDDKILTAWNGLMIAALAFGSRVLREDQYAVAAEKAAAFIMQKLRRGDGRLLARYRDGDAAYLAYADDYAFFIWGLIELHQATFNPGYLEQARQLMGDLFKYFWDEKHGGLYLYGSDGETLISRPKEIYDGALPSANSVAAVNLLRLARLTDDKELAEKARSLLMAFGGTVSEAPPGHTHFLMAVYLKETAPVDITIVGDLRAAETQEMLGLANRQFSPETILAVKPPGGEGEQQQAGGKVTAYVCRDFSCLPPTTDSQELSRLLTR